MNSLDDLLLPNNVLDFFLAEKWPWRLWSGAEKQCVCAGGDASLFRSCHLFVISPKVISHPERKSYKLFLSFPLHGKKAVKWEQIPATVSLHKLAVTLRCFSVKHTHKSLGDCLHISSATTILAPVIQASLEAFETVPKQGLLQMVLWPLSQLTSVFIKISP